MGPFLSNHREAIAAMDFFIAPALTFVVLFCFLVITHHRRCALHRNLISRHNSAWVAQQQLPNVFPYDVLPKNEIFDRAANFNEEVKVEQNRQPLPTIAFGWSSFGWSLARHDHRARPQSASKADSHCCHSCL